MNKSYYSKIKKDFDSEGFVKISNFFEKKKIKYIKKNLLIYLEKKRKFLNKREIHYADDTKLINSVHNLDWPYIKRFRKNKKILKIIKILLDDNLKDFGAELFAKPAKVGKAVPIHQDNFYWNVDNSKGVTVWIALDQVTKKMVLFFILTKVIKEAY